MFRGIPLLVVALAFVPAHLLSARRQPVLLESSGFWAYDGASGPDYETKPSSAWQQTDGTWVWPMAHDLRPAAVHFVWKPALRIGNADYNRFELGVVLNGYGGFQRFTEGKDFFMSLTSPGAGPLCPAGQRCVEAFVLYSTLRVYPKPWHIKLRYWKQPPIIRKGAEVPKYEVSTIVVGHPSPVSFFQTRIIPVFRHPACSTCHSFGSPARLAEQHSDFVPSALGTYGTVTPRGTQLRCGSASGCHASIMEEFNLPEKEWMSPAFDININWSTKADIEICTALSLKLPTDEALKKHFSEDARIAWALDSGEMPLSYPPRPQASLASQGNFYRILNAWLWAGRPCCMAGPICS